MNTDRKNFTGRLNSDIDERLFSLEKFRGDYSDAYNCLILSAIDSGIGLVKGFKGTTEVTTSYSTVAAKKVIGKCVDLPNYKIYYFVSCSTSTSNHAIYEVDVQTKVVTQVVKSSILKFTDTMRITGANVVDGKYLLYTDTVNEPRNIDIVRAKAGELTTELQILAAKQPPLEEIKDVTPITNFTFSGNNIRGNFFQFKYRYVYKDNTKSTFSPISEISTMGGLFFPSTEAISSYQENNALQFKYLIPSSDIKRVELASRLGNTGDFGISDIIDLNSSNVKIAIQIQQVSEKGTTLRLIGDITLQYTTTVTTSLYDAALDLVNQFNLSEPTSATLASVYVDPNTNIIYFVGNINQLFTVSEIVPVNELPNTQKIVLSNLPIVSTILYNTYLFSNNRQLIALDVAESNLEYDRVPLKSEAQELVNGSNVVYGGITEGYDLPVIDMLASLNNTDVPDVSTITTVSEVSQMGVFRTYGNTLFSNYSIFFTDDPPTNNINFTMNAGSYPDLDTAIYDKFVYIKPDLKIYRPQNNILVILSKNDNVVDGSAVAGIFPDPFSSITYATFTNSGSNITFGGALLSASIPIGTTFIAKINYQNEIYYYNYIAKDFDTLNTCILGLAQSISNNSVGIVSYQSTGNPYAIKVYATDQVKEGAEKTLTASASVLEGGGFIKNGLKNGDSYRYAIEYLDRTGKLSTVVTNQLCEVNVPFYPENGVPNAVITVKSRPPVWAERFQILRTKRRIVNSFLQYTVNNVAVNGNIFLLNFNNAQSNLPDYNVLMGTKLSYEFAEGDRLRFIRYADGTFITSHEDLPILGVNENGSLKIPLPRTFDTEDISLFIGTIVEVYRPNLYAALNAENELFYEIAMGGTIGNIGLANRYHIPDDKSGVDQTQSATSPIETPLIMQSVEGDVWYKSVQLLQPKPSPYDQPGELGEITILESDYISDKYPIRTSNIGRANAFDQDARQLFRKATVYHSDAYYVDSNVNNINRVYATSFKDYDQTFGAIKLFHLDGFMLYNFQENKTGTIPVNRQMVYNQDGSSSLILSSTLLNDCRYYDYVGGINNNPESFAYNQFNKYFVDIKNNAVCKIGGNGIIKISDMSMKSYFTDMFNTYKDANLTLTTQKPRFYGAWDEDNSLYVLCPEILSQGEDPIVYPSIVFNEVVSGWTSKIEIYPSCIVGAFGELFSWTSINAKMWRHNNNNTRNLFYGNQAVRSIEYVSAIAPEMVKSYLNMTQEAAMLPADRYDGIYTGVDPSIWAVPYITTSLGQQSNLIVSDFEKMEGIYLSRFWRDTTTPVADPLLNGDTLKGVWIKTTLTNGSTDDIGLYSTSVGFVVSK